MAIVLKDEKIVKDWGTLVEGCKGKRKEFYELVVESIKSMEAPGVITEEIKVAIGWLSGMFGNERTYLRVYSESMKDFRIYVGARDYGIFLNVFCCLTCEPGYLKKKLSGLVFNGDQRVLSYALNIFERQDFVAFKSVMEDAIQLAVDKLLESVQKGSSKLIIPKGFLGVS